MPETISQINIRESFKKNGIPQLTDRTDWTDWTADKAQSDATTREARKCLPGILATSHIFRGLSVLSVMSVRSVDRGSPDFRLFPGFSFEFKTIGPESTSSSFHSFSAAKSDKTGLSLIFLLFFGNRCKKRTVRGKSEVNRDFPPTEEKER